MLSRGQKMKSSCPRGEFRTWSSIGGVRIFNGIAQYSHTLTGYTALGSHASLRDMDFSLLQLSHEWLSRAECLYVETRLAYVQSGAYSASRLRRP